MADLEETMKFDPEEGIANLDVHLDRLKDAAEAEGFSSTATRREMSFRRRPSASGARRLPGWYCRRLEQWRSR